MSDSASPVEAREVAVPPDLRTFSELARIDYENAVLAEFSAAGNRSAEQWVRAILEQAPAELRRALLSGWSGMGLRLGPLDDAQHVLGWLIQRSTPDEVVLSTSSEAGLHGELFVRRRPDSLLYGSFIQLDTGAVRDMWNSVVHEHTPAMCQLLAGAVNRP
ncbi:hypothetical protein LZ318_06255 [Saccharopolyspora indica]|uniref:hypothetical protein n=1 Tax=Saccharopolyspora indica TaxID=1229659 RepID=UPI0022EB1552|nr:hypothetical protein [Saccharopolyspora indica]MDA3648867.1 hypothetical protein [Saccharopolyspora indica]